MRRRGRSLHGWVCAVAVAACALLPPSAEAAPGATQPGSEAVVARASSAVAASVVSLFPQAKGWFAIVADARFRTRVNGSLVPIFDELTHARVRFKDGAGFGIAVTFPKAFTAALRVGSTSDADRRYVDIAPLSARGVNALVDAGLVVYPSAYLDTDVLYKATPTHVDEYLLLHSASAPTSWKYTVSRGPGIAALRNAAAFVEAVDEHGRPWLRASRPVAVDRSGKRVYGSISVSGDQLQVSIDLSSLQFPVLIDPDWKSTGDMAYGRFYHRLNELPDGRVLATGGCSAAVCSGDLSLGPCRTVVRTAEALELPSELFSVVADSSEPRYFHVAESLPSGDVLIAGGCTTPGCDVTASAEVFSAASGELVATAPLPKKGAGHASLVLADGRVLLAGGCDTSACERSVFAFDEKTKAWATLASMNEARGRAGISLTSDGHVLVTGGCTSIACRGVLDSAELYDPRTDSWQTLPALSVPRAGHYQVTLPGGRVLVGGGCAEQSCATIHASTELYTPSLARFESGPDMLKARFGAVAALLPNGNVLVSQGCYGRNSCDLTNELYDSKTKSFVEFDAAVTTRAFHAVLVHGGKLVIANGGCQPGTCSWWNEYYDLGLLDGGLVPFDAGLVVGRDAGAAAGQGGGKKDAGVRDGGSGSAGKPGGANSGAAQSGCSCSLVARRQPPLRALSLALLLGVLLVTRSKCRGNSS